MSQTHLSNDNLFMICITHELQTIQALASHLNKPIKELYTYILDNYPTLMKEVNSTLFVDNDWWDDAIDIGDSPLQRIASKYNHYVTPKGLVLYKKTMYDHGIEYIKYVRLSLPTSKYGTPIVRLVNNDNRTTTTSLPKLVATHYLEGYNSKKRIYTRVKGDYSIENLYQV